MFSMFFQDEFTRHLKCVLISNQIQIANTLKRQIAIATTPVANSTIKLGGFSMETCKQSKVCAQSAQMKLKLMNFGEKAEKLSIWLHSFISCVCSRIHCNEHIDNENGVSGGTMKTSCCLLCIHIHQAHNSFSLRCLKNSCKHQRKFIQLAVLTFFTRFAHEMLCGHHKFSFRFSHIHICRSFRQKLACKRI